jgi:hypothetical protein
VPDDDSEEGYLDTIVPVDFERMGMIDSGALHRTLVSRLAPGCTLFVLFDCCHRYVHCEDRIGVRRLLRIVMRDGGRCELSSKMSRSHRCS